jgi:hypothetical protein
MYYVIRISSLANEQREDDYTLVNGTYTQARHISKELIQALMTREQLWFDVEKLEQDDTQDNSDSESNLVDNMGIAFKFGSKIFPVNYEIRELSEEIVTDLFNNIDNKEDFIKQFCFTTGIL